MSFVKNSSFYILMPEKKELINAKSFAKTQKPPFINLKCLTCDKVEEILNH